MEGSTSIWDSVRLQMSRRKFRGPGRLPWMTRPGVMDARVTKGLARRGGRRLRGGIARGGTRTPRGSRAAGHGPQGDRARRDTETPRGLRARRDTETPRGLARRGAWRPRGGLARRGTETARELARRGAQRPRGGLARRGMETARGLARGGARRPRGLSSGIVSICRSLAGAASRIVTRGAVPGLAWPDRDLATPAAGDRGKSPLDITQARSFHVIDRSISPSTPAGRPAGGGRSCSEGEPPCSEAVIRGRAGTTRPPLPRGDRCSAAGRC